MKVMDRFKMELSNQELLTEEQMLQLLAENYLDPEAEYNKPKMCKYLWQACIDVLETVANDVDLMTNISTEFSSVGQAYEFIEARIVNLRDKIASIPDEDEEYSPFALLYTRGGNRSVGSFITDIPNHTINEWE